MYNSEEKQTRRNNANLDNLQHDASDTNMGGREIRHVPIVESGGRSLDILASAALKAESSGPSSAIQNEVQEVSPVKETRDGLVPTHKPTTATRACGSLPDNALMTCLSSYYRMGQFSRVRKVVENLYGPRALLDTGESSILLKVGVGDKKLVFGEGIHTHLFPYFGVLSMPNFNDSPKVDKANRCTYAVMSCFGLHGESKPLGAQDTFKCFLQALTEPRRSVNVGIMLKHGLNVYCYSNTKYCRYWVHLDPACNHTFYLKTFDIELSASPREFKILKHWVFFGKKVVGKKSSPALKKPVKKLWTEKSKLLSEEERKVVPNNNNAPVNKSVVEARERDALVKERWDATVKASEERYEAESEERKARIERFYANCKAQFTPEQAAQLEIDFSRGGPPPVPPFQVPKGHRRRGSTESSSPQPSSHKRSGSYEEALRTRPTSGDFIRSVRPTPLYESPKLAKEGGSYVPTPFAISPVEEKALAQIEPEVTPTSVKPTSTGASVSKPPVLNKEVSGVVSKLEGVRNNTNKSAKPVSTPSKGGVVKGDIFGIIGGSSGKVSPMKAQKKKVEMPKTAAKKKEEKPVSEMTEDEKRQEEQAKLAKAMVKTPTRKTVSVAFGWAFLVKRELISAKKKIVKEGANIPDGLYYFEVEGNNLPRFELPWLAHLKFGVKLPALSDAEQSKQYLNLGFWGFHAPTCGLEVLKGKDFWYFKEGANVLVYCLESVAKGWMRCTSEDMKLFEGRWVRNNTGFWKAISGFKFTEELRMDEECEKEKETVRAATNSNTHAESIQKPAERPVSENKANNNNNNANKVDEERYKKMEKKPPTHVSATVRKLESEVKKPVRKVETKQFKSETVEKVEKEIQILKQEFADEKSRRIEMARERQALRLSRFVYAIPDPPPCPNQIIIPTPPPLPAADFCLRAAQDVEEWRTKVLWTDEEIELHYLKWRTWAFSPRTDEVELARSLLAPQRAVLDALTHEERFPYWERTTLPLLVELGYFERDCTKSYVYVVGEPYSVDTFKSKYVGVPWVPTYYETVVSEHPDSAFKGIPYFVAGKMVMKIKSMLEERDVSVPTSTKKEVIKHYLTGLDGEKVRVKFSKLPLRDAENDERPVPLRFGDVVYERETVVAHFKVLDNRSTYTRIADTFGVKNAPGFVGKMVLNFWDSVNSCAGGILGAKPINKVNMKIEYAKLLNIMCGQAVSPSLTPEIRKAIIERNVTRMTQVNVNGLTNLDSINQNLDMNTIYVANFISECALQNLEMKQKLIFSNLPNERKNALRVGPGYY